jgi:IPTL-CTERM motif
VAAVKTRGALVAAGLLLLMLAGRAPAATPVIDFNSAPGGGTVSYAGGASPVIGSNIAIDTVLGVNTPLHAATTHAVVNGILTFTSGPFVSFNNNVYTFGPGGNASFTITGAVPDAGIADTTLLTGELSEVTVDISSNTVLLFTASGSDTKDADLVAYFGIVTTAFVFGPGVVHINPTSPACAAPCAFSGDAFGIDIPNASAGTPIPTLSEWSLIGMMALLAAGAVWTLRRRPRAAA